MLQIVVYLLLFVAACFFVWLGTAHREVKVAGYMVAGIMFLLMGLFLFTQGLQLPTQSDESTSESQITYADLNQVVIDSNTTYYYEEVSAAPLSPLGIVADFSIIGGLSLLILALKFSFDKRSSRRNEDS